MTRFNRFWKNVPASVRKPMILFTGVVILLTGLAMLVLPGPGWLVIFLGFAVLATEFEFAEKARDQLITAVKLLSRRIKTSVDKLKKHKQ